MTHLSVRGVAGCTRHGGQARRVARRLYVVLCDCAAVLAFGVGGLEANLVGLDVGLAAVVVAGECGLDLVGDLAWAVLGRCAYTVEEAWRTKGIVLSELRGLLFLDARHVVMPNEFWTGLGDLQNSKGLFGDEVEI